MREKRMILAFLSISILFSLFLLALPDSFAAVPHQTPYYAVGSDFLVADPSSTCQFSNSILPAPNILFNNTKIYLDNNYDGVWDYSFSGNAGDTIYLNPALEMPRFGAKLHADKPISYYQGMSPQSCNAQPYWQLIPPINSWRNEYIVVGWYYIMTDKKINITIEENLTANTTISVSKLEKKQISSAYFARVSSNETFGLVSGTTSAAISGTDFFASYPVLKLVILEDGTQIKTDINNDGYFDNVTICGKGIKDATTIVGAHIVSSKRIAVYGNIGGLFALLPSTLIGNDFFMINGYAIALFSEFTGISNETFFDARLQKTNAVIQSVSATANQKFSPYFGSGSLHLTSTMPALAFLAYQVNSWGSQGFYHPYSQIYLTTYSSKKYISNNEANTFVVRIFNPFQKDNATNFNLAVNYPANFTSLSNVVIERRNLLNDAVLESASANYDLVIDGFTMNPSVNSILSYLGPLQYFEIRYDLITPDYLGTFSFPSARMTYDAQTWVIN